MKKFIASVSVVAALLVGPFSVSASPIVTESKGEIVRVYDESLASGRIYGSYGFVGSGFFLKDGYVVTNQHVSENAESFAAIQDFDHNLYYLELIATDKQKDLALYKVTQEGIKATPISEHRYLKVADSYGSSFSVYANTAENRFTHKTGKLEQEAIRLTISRQKPDGTVEVLSDTLRNVFSFSSEFGNSGSAVVNENEEVVGVVAARMQDSGKAIAVRLEDLKSFLKENAPGI